jgi:hypothetical protein
MQQGRKIIFLLKTSVGQVGVIHLLRFGVSGVTISAVGEGFCAGGSSQDLELQYFLFHTLQKKS